MSWLAKLTLANQSVSSYNFVTMGVLKAQQAASTVM